jgi:hypothetical protein
MSRQRVNNSVLSTKSVHAPPPGGHSPFAQHTDCLADVVVYQALERRPWHDDGESTSAGWSEGSSWRSPVRECQALPCGSAESDWDRLELGDVEGMRIQTDGGGE